MKNIELGLGISIKSFDNGAMFLQNADGDYEVLKLRTRSEL